MQIGTAKIDFEGLFIEGPAGRHSIEPKVMNLLGVCLLYTSPSPRDATLSRMPSSA